MRWARWAEVRGGMTEFDMKRRVMGGEMEGKKDGTKVGLMD